MKTTLRISAGKSNSPYLNSHTSPSYACKIITWSLIALAIIGVLSPFSYHDLPADGILEVSLLLAALSLAVLPKKSQVIFALAATAYILTCYVLMSIIRPANLLDFAQAYKAIYYVLPLSFFAGRCLFKEKDLVLLSRTLIALFLIKYGYSRLLNLTPRMGERPGIFIENNFELIFILILFYISEYKLKARERILSTIAIIAIVFLSGSRSALVALVTIFLAIYIKKIIAKTIIAAIFASVLSVGAFFIFINRMDGSIETIDRFFFLQIFLEETKNWNFIDYLIGSPPLTPLSDFSCKALSAYSALYSYSGDGSCYSVILHSFILRVIFDHGALVLFFILNFISQALKIANYNSRQRYCILLIILISALSVSAFNSIFTSLALAIAFSYPQVPKPHAPNISP